MSEKKYWRTLSELEKDPEFEEFLRREFVDVDYDKPGSTNRRRFMQLMGASFALAGASGCRWEKENVLPYTRRPEGLEPGAVKHFATVMDVAGAAIPVKVASFDNRPYKIEPNPSHPFSKGGTDAYAQASILTMFDPDRSQKVFNKDTAADDRKSFDEGVKSLSKSMMASQGKGVRFLSGATSSPTVAALRDELLAKMPQAKWVEYESLSRDNERKGSELAFGQRVKTHYHLDKAEVIVSLGGDLFGDHPAKLKHARDWADGRQPEEGKMNRLYVVEPRYTTTGAAADHRLPLRAEQILPFALALESALKGKPDSKGFLGEEKVQKMLKAIADDLKHHKGHAVVATGHQTDPAVHAVVHRINRALSNAGKTVTYTKDGAP
ncbi:MAG: TAT-variant-translocated molybdopterin oxidoreductase, partial [Myxococcota bacterium]